MSKGRTSLGALLIVRAVCQSERAEQLNTSK